MRLFRRGRIVGELWIPCVVADRMIAAADQWAPDETGGALAGYETDDGLVITDLIDAGPRAVRTPSRFVPDGDYQLNEIAKIYEASGCLHTYIGDWHTHPGSSPVYSRVDRSALQTISRSTDGRCARPGMIVLGGGPPWTAAAWRYHPGRWWDEVSLMRIRKF
jgi:integrative and conjugative element protein (TIGR02256 family)